MAHVIAFRTCLERLGFLEGTRDHMVAEGIGEIDDLATLPIRNIDGFVKHSQRAYSNLPEAERTYNYAYNAVRKLKAFKLWIDHMKVTGATPEPGSFDNATMLIWLAFLVRWEARESASPALRKIEDVKALSKTNTWYAFKEDLELFLGERRSDNGYSPLSYLIRDDREVTTATRGATYLSLDDDLIRNTLIEARTDDSFAADNIQLYEWLKMLLKGNSNLTKVTRFAKTKNGLAAWDALQEVEEGPAGKLLRRAVAYASISKATFTAKNKGWTFNQYVSVHEEAHNILSKEEEPVAETKKVTDFLDGIQCPELKQIKAICISDPKRLDDFQAMTAWFLLQINSAGILGDGIHTTRRIAQVKTTSENRLKRKGVGSGGKAPRAPTGKDSNGKTLQIHTDTYPGKDFRNLTPAQMTQVQELRAKEKSKRDRKAAALQKAEDENSDSDTSAPLKPTQKTKFKKDKNGRKVASLKKAPVAEEVTVFSDDSESSDEANGPFALKPPAQVDSSDDDSTQGTVEVVEVVTPPRIKAMRLADSNVTRIPKKKKNAGDQFGKAAHVAEKVADSDYDIVPPPKKKARKSIVSTLKAGVKSSVKSSLQRKALRIKKTRLEG